MVTPRCAVCGCLGNRDGSLQQVRFADRDATASFCVVDYESAWQLNELTMAGALTRLKEEFDAGGDSFCRVGSQFGPYRLLRLLGRGRLARVYEAQHTVSGAKVALKVISARHSADRSFRLRLSRNVLAIARLHAADPNLVPILDWGEIDERPYVVMPVSDALDLDRLLAQHTRLTPASAVAVLSQIAAALDALSSQGGMHRNIRPDNILADRDRAILLAGLSKLTLDDPGAAHPMNYAYSAPETVTDDMVTFRADIYALTCVFYECLTGDPPYPVDSLGAVIGGHLQQPIPQPSERVGVPVGFDDVVARGMAKKPEQRYDSAGALALAARQALAAAGWA
ncbi:serine/threonine-protein kinase [Mycobacterium asiaticum]|nr:serine/threonine-protein kinase [Mycobacterium asiaticum]